MHISEKDTRILWIMFLLSNEIPALERSLLGFKLITLPYHF